MTKTNLTKHYDRNCTNCVWFEEGYCRYFELKRMKKKKVPENIINEGCKLWSDAIPHPLLWYIIELFDGEIV